MKLPSKQLSIVLGVPLLSVTLLASPVIALGAAADAQSPFCKNLPATSTKVTTAITDLAKKRTDAGAARDQKIADNRTKWDKDLADSRAKWDAQRQDNFTKLEAKATTDAQKTAVAQYVKSVTDAVTVRRAANDTARSVYRAGVDAAIKSRHTLIDEQISTFISAVNNQESTAATSCSADPTSTTAREAFRSGMKSARTAFLDDRINDDKVATQIAVLIKARDNTIKLNDDQFKAKLEAYRNELKASFNGKTI